MSDSPFEVRRGPVPGTALELVEIAAAVAADVAVAVVLDFSDSCPSLSSVLSKLPALLAPLARRWPVWVHTLGGSAPVAGFDAANVGHVVEGTVDLATAGDRAARLDAAGRGSFLAPTLAAIDARRAAAGLTAAVVLVVTDGRVSDLSPVAVPPALRVIGVMAGDDPDATGIWQQVLPLHPLFPLADAGLDGWCRSHYGPPVGPCGVTVAAGSQRLTVDGAAEPVAGPFEWDFRLGPLRLLVSDAAAAVTLRSADSVVVVSAEDAVGGPTAASLAAVAGALGGGGTPGAGLWSVGRGEAGFDAAWAAAAAAGRRADAGRPWAGGADVASLAAAAGDATAVLCLCRGDPAGPPTAAARVVLVGLRRTASPALDWRPGQATPFGPLGGSIRLRWDRAARRWQARVGDGAEVELNPRGGQRLPPLAMGDGALLTVLFSGELG